jgi:glycosyltransferase involved in cell wall biosynthesis/SAM-dependent methyltransferase
LADLNTSLSKVHNANLPLVSVIITSYNQARFLSDAIESVFTQTYSQFETVVVDDGSTDNAADVVARYPGVRYILQANQGLAAARNTGLRQSNGAYLVFLDADDCLLPIALETGVDCLQTHPECGFVSGHYSLIKSNGSPKPHPVYSAGRDHYHGLLRTNYIGMHATVMYRRDIFESIGEFNTALRACEDYDLYLRIAARVPIYRHDKVIAEYRQHGANMSCNRQLMLESTVRVLQSQWKYVKGNKEYEKAYETGIKFWQSFFGDPLFSDVASSLVHGDWRHGLRGILTLLRYYPRGFGRFFSRACHRVLFRPSRPIFTHAKIFMKSLVPTSVPSSLQFWLRRHPTGPRVGRVRFGSLRRLRPISRTFGRDRGLPIDRYYIERFLSAHAAVIQGHVLEIGDDTYTRRFGGEQVTKRDVLHISEGNLDATIVGDLTCADFIPSDTFDCVILTQTLHLIYDVRAALKTVYRIMKPGGVLLATLPGISQMSKDCWREYWCWSFTHVSARRLFEEFFPTANVSVEVSGNVLAAIAFLHGLAAEELRQEELDYRDSHYEVSIMVRAFKPARTLSQS